MIIRDIRLTDIVAAQRLLGELGYDLEEADVRARLEQVLAATGHRIFVAEIAGRVVGLLHVFERPALEKPCEAVVQAIVVDSECRGDGIGEALMRHAETWAADRNLDSTVLYTRTDRDRARAFYERIGYRLAGTSHLMRRERTNELKLTV